MLLFPFLLEKKITCCYFTFFFLSDQHKEIFHFFGVLKNLELKCVLNGFAPLRSYVLLMTKIRFYLL